jgi:hypothetical protein
MTAEEFTELVDDVGVDFVVAELIRRGFYVRELSTEPRIDEELLARGRIKMADALGRPLAGHGVTVETLRLGRSTPVQGYYLGESASHRHYELNGDGELVLPLVRGSAVRVHIEGGFTREFTVPDVDFDILAIKSDDSFIVPAGPVELPIRRV